MAAETEGTDTREELRDKHVKAEGRTSVPRPPDIGACMGPGGGKGREDKAKYTHLYQEASFAQAGSVVDAEWPLTSPSCCFPAIP